MTCCVAVCCPNCASDQVTRSGKSRRGEQRYRCRAWDCKTVTFMLRYRYRAYEPGVKEQVVDRALNGRGVRDTVGVLKISKGTVLSPLKKADTPVKVHPGYWPEPGEAQNRDVSLGRVEREAELDEPWSYVGKKSNPRWLWYAIDHATNTVLAYTFGRRQDEVFKELKDLLKPLKIAR